MSFVGVRDYRIIAGDDYVTEPARQDPPYLGEIIDDAMTPEALLPVTQGFWRLFGEDRPPPSLL